jgi:hypothetical protein
LLTIEAFQFFPCGSGDNIKANFRQRPLDKSAGHRVKTIPLKPGLPRIATK